MPAGLKLALIPVACLAAAAAAIPVTGTDAQAQRSAAQAHARAQSPAVRTARHAAVHPPGGQASLPPLPALHPKVEEPVVARAASARPHHAREHRAPPAPAKAATPARPATRDSRHAASAVAGSVTRAVALPNGVAVPPLQAPDAVRRMIEAGNAIARTPYVWGGGHGRWIDRGYDCSGSVSFVLAAAGLLDQSQVAAAFMSWGDPGPGRWVTIYAKQTHVWMRVAGARFDTVARAQTGSRWVNDMTSTAGYVVRHPPGL